MEAAIALRSARRSNGISQRALSRASGIPQPNLSGIETGSVDVTVHRCNRALRALGAQLVVAPSAEPTIADWADVIADDLEAGDEAAARTAFIRIVDSFAGLDGVAKVVLSAPRPGSTGHGGFDAALAALVDHLLSERSLPVPAWVHEVAPCQEPFHLTPNPSIRELVESTTPRCFRDRNVFVSTDFFDSV